MIRLTIMIACCRKNRWFAETLDSLLNSGYHFRDTEILICDDGAPAGGDGDVAEKYAAKHPGLFRVLHNGTNKGGAYTHNRLIREARGKYLLVFDADDIFVPFDIDANLDFLDQHPEYAATFGKKHLFSAERGYWGEVHGGDYSTFAMLICPYVTHNGMITRAADIRPEWAYRLPSGVLCKGAFDIVFWLGLGLRKKLYFTNEVRALYRMHGSQNTANSAETYRKEYKILREELLSLYPELVKKAQSHGNFQLSGEEILPFAIVCGVLFALAQTQEERYYYLYIAEMALPDDYAVQDYRIRLLREEKRLPEAQTEAERMYAMHPESGYIRMAALRTVIECGNELKQDTATRQKEYEQLRQHYMQLTQEQQNLLQTAIRNAQTLDLEQNKNSNTGENRMSNTITIDSANQPQDITLTPPPPSAPASAPASGSMPQQEPVYGDIPAEPVLDAVDGIKFDFNNGVRVQFPNNDKTYHVTLMDVDTSTILFSADTTPGALLTSVKKYYVKFRITIHEKGVEKPIFEYDMDLNGKEVMIQITCPTIGDAIGWFSYVERFQKKNNCKVLCVMLPHIADMFRKQYPKITFINKSETVNYRPYASYYMGLFFQGDVNYQPIDFRYIGLHRTAGYILGLRTEKELADEPPRFDLSAKRKIKEPYVVIACQSSSQAKYWNNPVGWDMVIDFLKQNGYKVVCVDKERVHGAGMVWNHMPWGVENETGDKPLQERIDVIKDADFFIGLSSGLSWVAWACRVPVVMISGFTHPTNEFFTPYRVINYHTCHSCWNDMRENFDHFDFFWCPRQKGTDRQFECTRLISPEQVISTIKQIPSFQKHAAKKK